MLNAFKWNSAAFIYPHLGWQHRFRDVRLARRLELDQPAPISQTGCEFTLDTADQTDDRYEDNTT